MQFFIISPLFLVWLKSPKRKWRYVGLSIVLGMLMVSWITTIVLVVKHNLQLPIFYQSNLNVSNVDPNNIGGEAGEYIYVKPWCRIAPYLIGCLLGYVMVRLKGKRNFLSPTRNLVLWCLAVTLALVDVYGIFNSDLGLATRASYFGLSRSAWAVAVAWVVFACLTGHGGAVDKLLSWNLWFPLSRLTYCAYLTHPVILSYYFQTTRAPNMISNTFAAIHFLGFTVLTYGVAFVTSLVFESPIIRLEKFLRGRRI